MIYRKELDGIRAIAVIAVIIYHLNGNYLPNGFLGVDIFLVLSGFLITSIITESLNSKKNFAITTFLKRRFFRIYPAYFTVVCCTLIVTYMTFSKLSANLIITSAIYSLFGIPNFFLFHKISASYFEINTVYPLLHLWSLGLELQFYLLWSVIILFANKFKINLGRLIIFITCFSFIIAIYFYFNTVTISVRGNEFVLGKKFVFYLLPSRIWEFGLGAIASIYKVKIVNKRIQELFALIGLAMIFMVLFLFKEADGFSPYLALMPCIGTFLFIICFTENNFICRLFTSKPLVAIGVLSYSLYLWHYPVIEFFKQYYEPYGLVPQFITILICSTLSILSYRFIESYYRSIKSLRILVVYGTCCASLVLLTYMYNQNEYNSLFYKFTSSYPGSCLYHPNNNHINAFDKKDCTVGESSYTPNILVAGSSHSNSFVPFLSIFSKKYGFNFVNITANSTDYTKKYLLKGVYEHDQGRINLHSIFYKTIRRMEANFDILITCPSWANSEQELFAETLKSWSHKFKMVILINHIPPVKKFKLTRRLQHPIEFSTDEPSLFLENEVKKYNNVFFISLNDLIIENGGLDEDKHALYFDPGHLNIGGSVFLAKKILQNKNHNILKSRRFLELAKAKN